ncbi:MAG: menaquinone biosynthetic enzyme MqnA/MqnD family protein [Vicinamibacterales bacterium]
MTPPVRLSAVSFLNARPLVEGLERLPRLFDVRVDLPSACAERLHRGDVEIGLVPAIEYLRGDYRLVPGMAIGSDGPILSVAVFTRVPLDRVRRLALDTSSRTSVALTRVLCRAHWRIDPETVPAAPPLDAMLADADAALVIGDPALDVDAAAAGVQKVDLGQAWRELTGLPFVYAAWAGRPGALGAEHLKAFADARDRGLARFDGIAAEAADGDGRRAAVYASYLRDNLRYAFGPRERAGLERFFALAAEAGIVPGTRPLQFY